MSVTMRRLILSTLGILAGLAAWPLTELALAKQAMFPSYFTFSLALGVLFGTMMGGFFGSSQGIGVGSSTRFRAGLIQGAIVGLFGGIIGFLVGQAALLIVGEIFVSHKAFMTIGYPLSRVVGWSCLGFCIGAIEGIRTRSFRLIRIGITGGWIGGLLGGVAIEYLHIYATTSMMVARLAGMLILGLLIGFFYGLVENRFSFGTLKMLNGTFKGKEYLINFSRIRLGHGSKADIRLEPYDEVADLHAEVRVRRGMVYLRGLSKSAPVLVNDDPIDETQLKYEDVIRVGKAKFIFI